MALLRDIARTLRADPREALATLAVCGLMFCAGYLILLGGN